MRIQSGRLCDVCVKDEQMPGFDWSDVMADGGITTGMLLEAIDRYKIRVANDREPGAEFWERHLDQMRIGLAEHGRDVRGEQVRQ
jgi:hypothetical protein